MSARFDNDDIALIDRALAEDIGAGDVTTDWTIPDDAVAIGRFIARQEGVIAGLEVARHTFERIDGRIRFHAAIEDGGRVEHGRTFAEAEGPTRRILTGERTALNFLRHLSGVATLTSRYVQAVAGTDAQIIDTRKTTPGMRRLEKEAVLAGGGMNHRFGLYDMILIKDNHIAATGSITNAVTRCRERRCSIRSDLRIEVEAANLEQVEEAAGLPVDRIMLDNMDIGTMRAAVDLIRRRAGRRIEIEASGAIMLEHVRAVAETGVDLISVGALTHSAPALDISLDIE